MARPSDPPAFRSAIYVKGNSIRYVHLPPELDAARVIRERFRRMDSGKKQFAKRVPKPVEERQRLAPLVSEAVTEAIDDGGAGVGV